MKIDYRNFIITDEETTIQRVFELLSQEKPLGNWSIEALERAIHNSLCASIYDDRNLIAFARTITDYSTICIILDAVVDPPYRNKGIGKALFSFFHRHPALQGTTQIVWTQSGSDFFESIGYRPFKRLLLKH